VKGVISYSSSQEWPAYKNEYADQENVEKGRSASLLPKRTGSTRGKTGLQVRTEDRTQGRSVSTCEKGRVERNRLGKSSNEWGKEKAAIGEVTEKLRLGSIGRPLMKKERKSAQSSRG